MDRHQSRRMRIAAAGAVALGLAAGSYGIASAASTSGSSSSAGPTLGTVQTGGTSTTVSARQSAPQGWGHQRPDETVLTGDTASKVEAAAVARVGGGATVSRVETDADGHAAYEVHMVKPDGTLVTVYVDKQFDVVGVETGMPAPPQSQP